MKTKNKYQAHSLVRNATIIGSFFLMQQQQPATTVASSSSSSSSTTSHRRESLQSTLEAARYSSLPPTVFAPGGRLHGVERVAKEALLSFEDAGGSVSDEEAISCGALTLHCGFRRNGGRDGRADGEDDDDDGEFAVMVGIGATSPFLHRDEAYLERSSSSDGTIDFVNNPAGETFLPLTVDESTIEAGAEIAAPLAILSPTLIVGTGGKAIDSTILLRRSIEVALSMYSNDNGGVDWFVSHSLEGMAERHSDNNNIMKGETAALSSLTPSITGGAAGVDVTSLVRRVADMAQSSTQSLGGRYGRMLSSSLLAVGARSPPNINNVDSNTFAAGGNSSSDNDTLILWRVDPTGQFWRLDAAAVGRGAISVESELLRRVRRWKRKRTQLPTDDDGDEFECDVFYEDIRAYLGGLSVEEAVKVATDSLVDGILGWRKRASAKAGEEGMMTQLEWGLRKRVQVVVVRSNTLEKSKSPIEIF